MGTQIIRHKGFVYQNKNVDNINEQQGPKVATYKGRTHAVVNLEDGTLKESTDIKQASSPEQIHQFVMKYGKTLKITDLKLLTNIELENRSVIRLEQSKLPPILKDLMIKIVKLFDSIISFFKNHGTSDSTFIDKIHRNAKELIKSQPHVKWNLSI